MCSQKSTCLQPFKNKKFPHSRWIVIFTFWMWPFIDKLTDCGPRLYPLQKEIFFLSLSPSLFPCSYLTFAAGLAAISLTAGRHPLPLKLRASNNSVQFNHQTIMGNPAWGSNTPIGVSLFFHFFPDSVFFNDVVWLAAGSMPSEATEVQFAGNNTTLHRMLPKMELLTISKQFHRKLWDS